MNKMKYILTLLLFCSFTISARAQIDLAKKAEENEILKSDIKALTKDSSRLSQEIVRLKNQVSKDSVTLNKLKKEKDNLESLTSIEVQNNLWGEITRLEERIEVLDGKLNDIKKRKKSVNEDIAKETNDADIIANYTETQGREFHQRVINYINQKYSAMHVDKLDALKDSLSQYPDKHLEARLSEVISDKERWFDPGMEYITDGRGYNKTGDGYDEVVAIREKLIEWLKNNKSSNQLSEVDSLDIKLSRMNSGIKFLQEIVANVNADEKIQECRKSKGTASAHEYTSKIEALTTKEKGNEDFKKKYERYIEMIPYLKKLLDEYRKELENSQNALPTLTEKKITNLKVK